MKKKHYVIENLEEFSEHAEALKKLGAYLGDIENIFPVIEEVFGETWNDGQINIKLNDSTGGASYSYSRGSHVVEMGINNGNIQKKHPENLWGCLFHETHHAFLNLIIRYKRDGKIFNGGHKAEVFNYAFMATTYLKLKETGRIALQQYKSFFSKLNRELKGHNRNYRKSPATNKCEYENELEDDAMEIFQKYIDLFSINENFSEFISIVKSSDSIFTNLSSFQQDLYEAEEALKS